MAEALRYWRVSFFADGRVNRVRPIKGPGHARWIVVEAPTEEEAKRRAYNIYSARKKRERKKTLHAEGRCICGRPQDRLVEKGARKGEKALTCSVCEERRHGYYENAKEHPGRTFEEAMAQRDEGARVASNLERQRDRRSEIRLETLIDVRNAWQNSGTIGVFSQWLKRQIESLTKATET